MIGTTTGARRRVLPVVGVALLDLALRLWMWGGRYEAPPTDQASYLLQAEILASGRWTMPARVLPAFFEQHHVLVAPALASKYPPGHALALTPGVALGMPALMPLLLAALVSVLLFVLARRAAGATVACLTVALWIGAPSVAWFLTSYFSQTTSTAAWLLAVWAALRWRDDGRLRWMLLTAVASAWLAITRPLTAIALLLPLSVAILWWLRAAPRRWWHLPIGVLVAVPVLALVPLHGHAVTGAWSTLPHAQYARRFLPDDRMGFGATDAQPAADTPADLAALDAQLHAMHAEHTPDRLPRIYLARLQRILDGVSLAPLWLTLALAAVALVRPPPGVRPALAAFVALWLAYGVYAHLASWTLYTLEALPGLVFVVAVGLHRIGAWGLRAAARWPALAPHRPRLRGATLGALAALLVGQAVAVGSARRTGWMREHAPWLSLRARAERLPAARVVVFVRYGPAHVPERSLLVNPARLDDAHVWYVYDRGDDDARLLRRFPDRTPYLYREADDRLEPMPVGGAAVGVQRPAGSRYLPACPRIASSSSSSATACS